MIRKLILCSVVVLFLIEVTGTTWSSNTLSPKGYFDLEEEKTESSKLSNTTAYCYHFTWMGQKFNNRTFSSIRNKTCNQFFKDKKTLCIDPMTATFNGNEPDIDYILDHHALEATCRMSQGQVCVKYTVYSHDRVSYQTRYCSVVNIDMEGPMKTGCLTEKRGSELIEVCACRSSQGPKGICNKADRISISTSTYSFISSLILYGIYVLFLK